MKRRAFILVAALAIVTVLFLLIQYAIGAGARPPDRVVQGKPVSQRDKETLASDQYYLSTPVLKSNWESAVPFLIPAMQTPDSRLNTAYVNLWPKLPDFIKRRLEPPILAQDRRMRAVVALREMGPSAKGAVPALIARLSDPDGHISLHSAIALGNIGPDARSAVPDLEPFLQSKSHTVRVYTANALWKITRQTEPALSVLEEGLKDHNASFRWAAAVFLGEMGPAAKRTIPLLEQATRDPDKEVASLSIQALAQIGPETMPILTNLLSDPDPALRISAAIALEKLGPQAREAVPLLVKALEDHDRGAPILMGRSPGSEEVCVSAAAALKAIDPKAAVKAGVQ